MSVTEFLLIGAGFSVVATLFAFWIWMLIDCLRNETSENNEKLLWALIIVFTKFIGAGLYFFIRRPQRVAAQLENG